MGSIADHIKANCATSTNVQPDYVDNCDLQRSDFVTLIINTGDAISDWNDSATITAAKTANTLRVIKVGVEGTLNESQDVTIDTSSRSRLPNEFVTDTTHSATASIPHRLANKGWAKDIMADPGQITQFAWVTASGILNDTSASPSVKVKKASSNGIEVLQFDATWNFLGDPTEEYPALTSQFGT